MVHTKPWEWFQRIVERASISAAASDLDITAAALSQMLKREERLLGVRLFQRTTRKLTLTHEGNLWYRATIAAQAALDQGLEQLHQSHGELVGSLRIAAPSDFGRTRLMNWLSDFCKLYPQVIPIIQIYDKTEDLIAESIDLALRYGMPQEPNLIAHPLYPENRRVIVAAPEYWMRHGKPAHPSELVQYDCLAFNIRDRPHVYWSFKKGAESLGVNIKPSRLSNDGAVVGVWSCAGYGVMYRSYLDVQDSLNSGQLELALEDWQGEDCPMYLVRPGNRLWPARVRAFWSFCTQQARAQDISY